MGLRRGASAAARACAPRNPAHSLRPTVNASDLIAALGLFFVFEGIVPFLNPRGLKRALAWVLDAKERDLRIAGFGSMLIGLAILYFAA